MDLPGSSQRPAAGAIAVCAGVVDVRTASSSGGEVKGSGLEPGPDRGERRRRAHACESHGVTIQEHRAIISRLGETASDM
jgi:hypothetical protein